ncbi:NAD(P)-binding protein [Sporormia fimetaria CBS 119925]|uniref:NAD(P)-binding protein n=1 Tax=Sporormia fimetaria CBS 119925 TaxID=1340428 RepID=A0A6A6VI97_9PLEO|nr:NAD(P)-binding protein [Sporormia fimetaria CBS 119925]
MPLTVLSDTDVRTVLHSLSKEDVLEVQQNLADALHYYSTTTEDDGNGCCSSYQPLRTSLKRSDGQTTLFMPASSNEGLGVKIVTLAVPNNDTDSSASERGLKKSSSHGSEDTTSTSTTTTTTTTTTLSDSSTTPSSHTRSSTSATTPPSSSPTTKSKIPQSTKPRGTLTLLDPHGSPRALLNAEELTGFRTALASVILFKKRTNVHDVLVFGAGKQAYWHIRLSLLLRGSEMHHLTIVNRSYDRARGLIESLFASSHEQEAPLYRPKIQILTPSARDYELHLKTAVQAASVIFCTTPSLTPVFPASYLTGSHVARKKGRYIAAIGSYKPHMRELDPELLKQSVAPEHAGWHFHKHAKEGGAVVVDSVDACLKEAGEIIAAGLRSREVVEIGELIMLGREAERRRKKAEREERKRRESSGEVEAERWDEGGVEVGGKRGAKWFQKMTVGKKEVVDEAESGLVEWLQRGNVVYKSVGLGLMDVVVGMNVVRLADERGVGVRVEDF